MDLLFLLATMLLFRLRIGRDGLLMPCHRQRISRSTDCGSLGECALSGIRENGGQYTHAAIWTVMAFAEMGDHRHAWELFR